MATNSTAAAQAAAVAHAKAAALQALDESTRLDGRGPLMLGVAIALLATTWLSVSLRIFVRAHMIRSFGWDDGFMILTLVRTD